MTERHLYTNRLIREKSPYLLQHAHNPVDWYSWGEEAFELAQNLDKPIFLSIGYATCHWCHVMEKECFENVEIAQMMNDTFVNIKVDREELPEVDGQYMEFAQSMMTGSAGWPLNLILTPQLEPFFAATYLPPKNDFGMIGLPDLISQIKKMWQGDDREKVIAQASKIVEVFVDSVHVKGDEISLKEKIMDTADILFHLADPVYGGVRGAPKFPVGYQYDFLMHYSSVMKESRALFLAERTLDMMQRGGIQDHLGGGFSRYSVDEKWLVPHFEKMLYDNALLAIAYVNVWKLTKKQLFKDVCERILDYILREMTDPDSGGFYSAEDADTDGHEGYFYTWTYDEVIKILGEGEKQKLFCEFFDITVDGNFEGRNILNTKLTLEEFAVHNELDFEQFSEEIEAQKKQLWNVRQARKKPFKDDKVLCGWNGLMIASMCLAGSAFDEEKYINAAEKAAQFIQDNLWKNGRLLRRWREGEALYLAELTDYAYLMKGLLALFESGRGSKWLMWAITIASLLEAEFKNDGQAFYQTDGKDPFLLLRRCHYGDGAEPSGNAIQCENLLKLYQITGNSHYLNQAKDILRAVKKYIDQYPPGYCYHIMNLQRYYDSNVPLIVVALNDKEELKQEIINSLNTHFIAHKNVIFKFSHDELIQTAIPDISQKKVVDGKTTVYICKQGVCLEPLTDLTQIKEAILTL